MTDIAVATNNPDRAWVTFSDYNNVHKVYETNDAGSSCHLETIFQRYQ